VATRKIKRKPGRPRGSGPQKPVLERMLDAADEVFAEHGIHATGVNEIAARAGVSKMSMYQYVESKEELVEQYLRRNDERLGTWMRGQIASGGLIGAFAALRAFIEAPDFCGCRFIRAAAELDMKNDPAADVIRAHKQGFRTMFEQEARREMLRDPGVLAERLMLIFDGALARAATSGDKTQGKLAEDLAGTLIAAAKI
jgi:AcrR family transcriptional regulator